MENASKHFWDELRSATLLFQPNTGTRTITLQHNWTQQLPKCHERCPKAGRLILNQHQADKHTQVGFTRVTAMAEAQPDRCLFDYRTLSTKLIKKLREIVWHLIWVSICRHSSAIFKGLIIYLEPCKPKELPLNLYNPVWKGLWTCNSHTCQKVAKKLELPLCLSSLSGQHKLGPVSEGENHH